MEKGEGNDQYLPLSEILKGKMLPKCKSNIPCLHDLNTV